MYTDILTPSGWGTDSGAASRFIQSDEATLGVTIAYELPVNGSVPTYWTTGSEAMFGISEVSLNKWLNNENIVHLEDRAWGLDLRSKIENSSQVWHHDYHQGQCTLLENFRTPFTTRLTAIRIQPIVKGCSTPSFFKPNIIAYSGRHSRWTSPGIWRLPGSKGAQNAIYYGSNTTSAPSVNDSEKPDRQLVCQWQFAYPGSQVSNEYSWTLTNIVPRAPFNNFY